MANIILITGCPGSGKSTVGQAVAERFAKSVHIKVDDIRESLVRGFEPPGDITPEAIRQFELARAVAVHWACTYRRSGFTVIIDDVCLLDEFTEHYSTLDSEPNVTRVLLNPTREALTERILQRGGPHAEFFVREGISIVQGFMEALPKRNWAEIDSSNQTVEQSAQAVIDQLDIAS